MVKRTLATIGYEGASMESFLRALKEAKVELLVDIRAVASSRRPGFSKNALAANLAEAGIDYLQLRGLGTPSDGRAAARARQYAELERIYAEHLKTPDAQDQLAALVEVVRGGRKACLMCFEADHRHCHRRMVAEAVGAQIAITVTNLVGDPDDE